MTLTKSKPHFVGNVKRPILYCGNRAWQIEVRAWDFSEVGSLFAIPALFPSHKKEGARDVLQIGPANEALANFVYSLSNAEVNFDEPGLRGDIVL